MLRGTKAKNRASKAMTSTTSASFQAWPKVVTQWKQSGTVYFTSFTYMCAHSSNVWWKLLWANWKTNHIKNHHKILHLIHVCGSQSSCTIDRSIRLRPRRTCEQEHVSLSNAFLHTLPRMPHTRTHVGLYLSDLPCIMIGQYTMGWSLMDRSISGNNRMNRKRE